MGVSKNNGTPKSSILIGFSIIFTIHFGVPLFLETPIRGCRILLLVTSTVSYCIQLIAKYPSLKLTAGTMKMDRNPKRKGTFPKQHFSKGKYAAGWWFQIFFYFHLCSGKMNWLQIFKGVDSTTTYCWWFRNPKQPPGTVKKTPS